MKYNNNSKKFADWDNKKLQGWAVDLDRSIYIDECYGTKDVMMLDGIMEELEKRGVEWERELVFNN